MTASLKHHHSARVALALCTWLAAAALLPAPAVAAAAPKTPKQLAAEASRKEAETAAEKEALYHRDTLIAIVDGYKVYEVRGGEHLVYLTIPCAETSWTIEERSGKLLRSVKNEVLNVECKP